MAESNPLVRLEAFSDGVFAIAITLLVIEFAVPSVEAVHSTGDLWAALAHMGPGIFSFCLSFLVILITWVNHTAGIRLVNKTTPSFLYANGFLLFTIAIIPFPSALLGEYLLTDYAAPTVVVYNGVIVVQAVAWILLTGAALRNNLAKNETAAASMRTNHRNGFMAVGLYGALTILAIWFPHVVAAVTTLTWIYWLIHGIRIRHE